MRIGLFADVYPPVTNGVSTSVLMLKNSLEKLGHEVFVVTVNNDSLKYSFEENGHVIRVPGIPIGLYGYRISGSIYPLRIIMKIKKWNLDIIHSHTEFGIGTFARIMAKQMEIPLVHTYHTMYEDYIHYITRGHFKGMSIKIVEYLTLFYCDHTISELVVPTKKAYDLFKLKYKVDRNIFIIPTGIELDEFYTENHNQEEIMALRAELGYTKNDFILMYLGRIAEEKNIAFLMEAQKILSKKYKNIKLLVIGDGPDLDSNRKKVLNAAYNGSTQFIGRVPLAQRAKYFQLGDIFVTASQSETQGITVMEALASSMPVVCIEDNAFINMVMSDVNGHTFKTKAEYIKIIDDLYKDSKKLKRLSEQARINVHVHSSKYYGERIIDVYKIALTNYKNKKKKSLWGRIKKVVEKNEKDHSS